MSQRLVFFTDDWCPQLSVKLAEILTRLSCKTMIHLQPFNKKTEKLELWNYGTEKQKNRSFGTRSLRRPGTLTSGNSFAWSRSGSVAGRGKIWFQAGHRQTCRFISEHSFSYCDLNMKSYRYCICEPSLKSIFIAKLGVVLNFCILINNKLTLVQKFKTPWFWQKDAF